MKLNFGKMVLFSLIIAILLSSTAIAEEIQVIRTLSTTNPTESSEFIVTLSVSGTDVIGIVENIPEGFSYTSTDHPETQTNQSQQQIIFSLVEETQIVYRVEAPSSGSGKFTGIWYDPLAKTEGAIEDTTVNVKSKSSSTSSSKGSSSGISSALITETSDEQTEIIEENSTVNIEASEEVVSKTKDTVVQRSPEDEIAQETQSEETEVQNAPFLTILTLVLIIGFAAYLRRND
ncbi:hypothetical protein V7O62_03655 [Methanolobus sp. ZRKC2]|uniref:hypothetical protein n=1 Tax=Methanolobus sp. ZRKC2 TaxID=3125783 RepID=UPI003252FAA7